jgi:hypothetical protein
MSTETDATTQFTLSSDCTFLHSVTGCSNKDECYRRGTWHGRGSVDVRTEFGWKNQKETSWKT